MSLIVTNVVIEKYTIDEERKSIIFYIKNDGVDYFSNKIIPNSICAKYTWTSAKSMEYFDRVFGAYCYKNNFGEIKIGDIIGKNFIATYQPYQKYIPEEDKEYTYYSLKVLISLEIVDTILGGYMHNVQ